MLRCCSNDFGNQPADKATVRAACEAAGYKGWVMEFVSIRGPEAHPLWTYFRVRVGCSGQ